MSANEHDAAHEAALDILLPDQESRDRMESHAMALLVRNALLQAIDHERERSGLSKRELADKIEMDPASLRRLFSSDDANPTLATVARLLAATRLRLQLVTDDGEVFEIPDSEQIPA